ncbi:flagellin, partial [Janthinobacterium lividum]
DASSTANDKTAMQAEYNALGQELYNVMTNTTFGGTKLLGDGSAATAGTLSASMTFQIGASSTEKMSFDVSGNLTSLNAALTGLSTNFAAAASTGATELTATANATIGKLAAAIDSVSTVRSALGATANRLDHVNTNLSNIATNTKAATGRIMDTDFATESSNMTSS